MSSSINYKKVKTDNAGGNSLVVHDKPFPARTKYIVCKT